MDAPLSWIKEYVDLDLPLLEIARLLTMAGLQVEEIRLVGMPNPYEAPEMAGKPRMYSVSGLGWDRQKIVVAQIDEVLPHPNADRLVLCRLQDGTQEQIVLTGAPNLFEFKGKGLLPKPIKVAYAREGALIYDGHQLGQVLTTLKRTKIRGVDSYSMVCSEKELGISEEHEGIMMLDDDAPTGLPLADYMGDAVLVISILPNMIRNACIIGLARELAALTGNPLRQPQISLPQDTPAIAGQVSLQIEDPLLNPRFVVGLVRGAEPRQSPAWVQRRLRLAGMRPINSIVDATNYVMLETGEPLHAFDYDVLVRRAGGKPPTIITRAALPGEKLTTLDGVEHTLQPFSILVCDTAGALSLAGVMGGLESEVTASTRNVLLEGASWNFINTRRTMTSEHMNSEAGYRFSRGVHPALAETGVVLGLKAIASWSGGQIASGLVDAYPAPTPQVEVELEEADVRRILGIELSAAQIAALLERLEFKCTVRGGAVVALTPPHRVDIGEGVTGKADLLEEVARIYGYDLIPETRLSDTLPPQRSNRDFLLEERLRDLLSGLGLQEVVNYRLTSSEREARLLPRGSQAETPAYVHILNPLTTDQNVMRRSALVSVLENLEKNIRLRSRLALFEIGQVYLPVEGQPLPDEPRRLAIALSGLSGQPAWDRKTPACLDFYDLKGILETVLDELHIQARVDPLEHPSFHPGKCASLVVGDEPLGVFGELHPLVKQNYDFLEPAVLAAELDLEKLLAKASVQFEAAPVPSHPPVLEDIAVIVDETVPVAQVMELIRQAGGKMLAGLSLFDVFRGEQIGAGKKSLAFSLTYQAPDRTLTDQDAAQIRNRVVRRLEQEVGAKLRSQ